MHKGLDLEGKKRKSELQTTGELLTSWPLINISDSCLKKWIFAGVAFQCTRRIKRLCSQSLSGAHSDNIMLSFQFLGTCVCSDRIFKAWRRKHESCCKWVTANPNMDKTNFSQSDEMRKQTLVSCVVFCTDNWFPLGSLHFVGIKRDPLVVIGTSGRCWLFPGPRECLGILGDLGLTFPGTLGDGKLEITDMTEWLCFTLRIGVSQGQKCTKYEKSWIQELNEQRWKVCAGGMSRKALDS